MMPAPAASRAMGVDPRRAMALGAMGLNMMAGRPIRGY